MTVKVNGATASATYGQGSTAASVASAIKSAVQSAAGSFLTATLNGTTVSLASIQGGTATNWPVTVSVSYDTTDFTHPSFTATASGMSGGANGQTTVTSLYSYNLGSLPNGTHGYDAVGNVVGFNDSVMGQWNFAYDHLNRLTTATGVATGSYTGVNVATATQAWTYDSFGNRLTQSSGNNQTPTEWAQYASANNRMSDNSLPGTVSYDGAGRLASDGSKSYLWEAQGWLCGVAVGTAYYQYIYDAEGRLVTTASRGNFNCYTGTTTKADFVVDQAGRQVSETDGAGTWKHTNVYANGELLLTYDPAGVHYAFSDWIGDKRVQASWTGAYELSCWNFPFDDAFGCSASDATEHRYTGKEHDPYTGLDLFGAREFTGYSGRFLSPDWVAKATPIPYAKLGNPQTLNLYAYVENNPISMVDADGHIDCSGKNAEGPGCQAIEKWNSDHGISPTAAKSNFPGVVVKLPNGSSVADPHSSTGKLTAPTSDVSDVAAAGRKAGQDAAALGYPLGGISFTVSLAENLGTGGNFDYQRVGSQGDDLIGGFQQLPQFRDVSNFNVGLFAQQAGMTLGDALQTAGDFAKHFSGNYRPESPYGLDPRTAEYIRVGYKVGETSF